MAELLLQTRVPQSVGKWVAKVAEAEGISLAAWLRRSVMAAAGGKRVDAWLARPREDIVTFHHSAPRVHMTLQLLERAPSGQCLFALLHPPTHGHAGEPWSEHYFTDSEVFKSQHERVLVLRGSPMAWRIASSMFDTATQRVELWCEPVPPPSPARVLIDDIGDFVSRYRMPGQTPATLQLQLTKEEELILHRATAADVGAELAARVVSEGPRGAFATLFGVMVTWDAPGRTLGPRKNAAA
jgi:hypothetical protein